jgi:hypothetical protein
MAKYYETAGLLEKRIRSGDYTTRELPTELQLAEEMGISRRTARRALQQLMEAGLLLRKPYGRAEINLEHAQLAGKLRLAFLSPAFNSPGIELWRLAVSQTCSKRSASVRSIDFVHWDDPTISQTLAGFDGVFLVPSSEPIPPLVSKRLASAQNLVALDTDLSEHGIPSVQLFPPAFMQKLGDHLYDLGHRSIDCLNTQPNDVVIQQRLDAWSRWKQERSVDGQIIDTPVQPYEKTMPKAYETMSRLLKAGQFKATGLVCLTDDAATGAIRALHEHGIRIGKEVSVCTTDINGFSRYQCPSRTSVELPDPGPYLAFCLEWLAGGIRPWTGPMLMQPSSATLFIGESSGPKKK